MANRVNTLRPGTFSQHRSVAGAPVGADGAVSASFPDRGGLLACTGYETLVFGVRLTGGTTPEVDVDVLIYDEDADTFFVLDEFTGMADGDTAIADVYCGRIFLRITKVTGNPTAAEIRVMPASGSDSF